MNVKIVMSQTIDAKRLAEVYNLSFYSDYAKYGECPVYNQTEETMLSRMKNFQIYKIVVDNEFIVGAVSVKHISGGCYFLCVLCVIPEYANRGIGQQAMKLLNEEFPDATHWALETPKDKLQNHYFYKKFGFSITREYVDGNVHISYFERDC